MIVIKNKQALSKMEDAGYKLATLFEELSHVIKPGVSTGEIDAWIESSLQSTGLVSKTKGFRTYKHASCISVNDEVVHGVPNNSRILVDGDLVKVDVCASFDGYCADMARPFFVGTGVSKEAQDLVSVAQAALDAGIKKAVPRKRFLKSKFAQEQRLAAHHYTRLIRVTKKLKELLINQHTELETLKKTEQLQAVAQSELEQMKVQLENFSSELMIKNDELAVVTIALQELRSITEQRENELKKAQAFDAFPTKNPEYSKLQAQAHELENKASRYSILQQETRELMNELQEVTALITQLHDTQMVAQQQLERKQTIRSLITDLKKIKHEINHHSNQQKRLLTKKREIEQHLSREPHLQATTNELVAQKEQVLQELGTITAHLQKLSALEQERVNHHNALAQLSLRADNLAIIAQATGKDGVQALLIEEAIPEIEQEANYLLAKLTNNQAHVFIESLKDLKKGGAKETLDIKISDALGIRPYELFSGGEAFRIDFALRIAISKLLARRAGTSLQTLIIDEGFGSQDEEGLSHIMDALHKIQDDFAKIIIVSHLPSMKEQFPVHFVIEKGPRGSKVRIVEND